MCEFFYIERQPSLKDPMLHYMDTDSFVLSFSKGNVDDKYMDWSNLDTPIKTKNQVPGKFNHELRSRKIEEFIVLKQKTYSLVTHVKSRTAKEKGIKKENNGQHEDYYHALMDNNERIVEECRVQKFGNKMSTIRRNKCRLNNVDDKKFYVIDVKIYPHDENLYPFKRDLINKMNNTNLELDWGLAQFWGPGPQAASLLDTDKLTKNILQLTTNDDRKFIDSAIELYNDLYS